MDLAGDRSELDPAAGIFGLKQFHEPGAEPEGPAMTPGSPYRPAEASRAQGCAKSYPRLLGVVCAPVNMTLSPARVFYFSSHQSARP